MYPNTPHADRKNSPIHHGYITTIFLRYYHSTENKWIIVLYKGFTNNLVVVQYQKYFEVCRAFFKIVKLVLTKKNRIYRFGVNQSNVTE